MKEIKTEEQWLACDDPQVLGFFGRGRFDPQRFRHLAVAWGGQVRDWLQNHDVEFFDAYSIWVNGEGEYPSLLLERPVFSRLSTHLSHVDSADFFGRYLRNDDAMMAATCAGRAVGAHFPFPSLPPVDYSKTHRRRAAEARRQEEANLEAIRQKWWDDREAHSARVCRQFCDEFRDVAGNPFRPVSVQPEWLTRTVMDLARNIDTVGRYDLLPVLADAFEDAGCDCDELLSHSRGPGPHVRGCWAIDTALGRV